MCSPGGKLEASTTARISCSLMLSSSLGAPTTTRSILPLLGETTSALSPSPKPLTRIGTFSSFFVFALTMVTEIFTVFGSTFRRSSTGGMGSSKVRSLVTPDKSSEGPGYTSNPFNVSSGPYTVTRSTSVVRLAMAYPSGGYFATSTLRGTDLSGAVIGTSTSTTEGVTSTLWRGPFSPYTCNATDRETVSVDPLTLTTPLTAVTSSRSDSEPRTNTFVGLITGSPALKPLGRSPTRST